MISKIIISIMWIGVIVYMLLYILKLIKKEVRSLKLLPLIKSLFGRRLKLKDDSINITRLKQDLNLDILNPQPKQPQEPKQESETHDNSSDISQPQQESSKDSNGTIQE